MKRPLARMFAALLLALPIAAQADNPVVIELFTSQGCSSCPPADLMLHQLAERDDVIALALHVDYWDYIGWKDDFADPANAERQRGYAAHAGRRSIFTPQFVINGQDSVVGAKGMQLADAIARHADQPERVDLTLARSGGTLRIAGTAARPGDMVLHMLRYTPQRTARITRGENAGHTLDYANVTEAWTVLGEWNGAAPLALDVPISGDKPVVVLVQDGLTGPILGAAQLR